MSEGKHELPPGWDNHDGYRAIFNAALSGICANPQFFGPIFQQSPAAAVDFAAEVVAAAIAKSQASKSNRKDGSSLQTHNVGDLMRQRVKEGGRGR